MKQSDIAKKGAALAMKWLNLDPDKLDSDDAWTISGMGAFYEWLLNEGEVVTEDQCTERASKAESWGYEDGAYWGSKRYD
jgi:hypothetical protein